MDQFLYQLITEVLRTQHSQEEKQVYIVGTQLAQSFFQCSAGIGMTQNEVIDTRGHHNSITIPGECFFEQLDRMGIESEKEEKVDPLIDRTLEWLLARTVGACQTDSRYLDSGPT
jgi:hypothetical protein